MIIKHVPIRSLGKSDFASLTNYITDAQNKAYRLSQVLITNCEAGTLPAAIEEVLATQYINTRAKNDKTYHLIVSFRAGEQPSADTLKSIEARISAGLGYGEHQRISAVHNDTDNLHIHIAINKIHPTRHTIHEPYYPHRTLAELCQILEKDFGLERDNHELRQRGAAARAADMEKHAGIESLVGWIKRECLDEIRGAQSWIALHQVMRDNDLMLRARGNGLVIVAGDGTTIKASTLGRDLSKSALEKHLGPFEESPLWPEEAAQRRYQKAPVRMQINTTELYAKFRNTQKGLAAGRTEALARAKRLKDQAVDQAKKANAVRRAGIKLLGGGRLTKRLLYSQASASLRVELDAIHKRYGRERTKLYQDFQRRTWVDWLKQEAMKGDGQALVALRAREAATGLKGDTIEGQGRTQPSSTPTIDNITKKGSILFRAGRSVVRDDGKRLQVSRDADSASIQAALRLATERYGERITVTGSPEFKAAIIRAAVDTRLPITLADPALERRRQALISQAGQTSPKPTTIRPGLPPIGQKPPPHRRLALRTLGQLDGLRIESGESVRPPLMPLPTPASATSKQQHLRAKLQADLEAKKAKRLNIGKGRSG